MKAAVIGLGHHGKRVASVVRNLPGVELAAVADVRKEALDWSELPPTVFKTTAPVALFAQNPVDLLAITTHGPSHAELAIRAMETGTKRVMVEKPMACSVAECEAMIEAARRNGARLAVNQSRRHDPFYRWLKGEMQGGRFGDLRCIWIQRPGIGLGCLGTHYFDLVRYLSGMNVKRVTAWVDPFIGPNPRGDKFVDPGGLVVMELDRRARAIVSQIEDGAGPMSIEIDLTGARIQIDERKGSVEIIERDRSVAAGPDRPVAYVDRKPPEGLTAKPNLTEMVRRVFEELLSDRPMECDAKEGLASIEVLVAAHLSQNARNVPIELPLRSPEERALWLPVT
jgi:predicted dehydrogenase